MKRDPELIRKLVLAVEDSPGSYAPGGLTIEGFTEEEVGYHAYLLGDAGLAKVADGSSRHAKTARILHLTSAGHDFAEAARNDSVWKRAIAELKDKATGAPIAVLQMLLAEGVKRLLSLG